MALTKEIVKTYRDALENDRVRLLADLQAVSGGIQVADRFYRFLEIEEAGESPSLEEVLGITQG